MLKLDSSMISVGWSHCIRLNNMQIIHIALMHRSVRDLPSAVLRLLDRHHMDCMSSRPRARGGWKKVIKNRAHALISKSSLSQRTSVLAAFYNYRLSVQNWSGDMARKVV